MKCKTTQNINTKNAGSFNTPSKAVTKFIKPINLIAETYQEPLKLRRDHLEYSRAFKAGVNER